MTDTNDQPGACAPVPLPEPVASRAPNALAVGQWVYREPERFLEKLCRISDAIAYGEACAAAERAGFDLVLGMLEYGDAVSAYRLQRAER
jgi:hypothetical protein